LALLCAVYYVDIYAFWGAALVSCNVVPSLVGRGQRNPKLDLECGRLLQMKF